MKKPPQDLGGFMSGEAIYKTQQSEFIMHNSCVGLLGAFRRLF